MQLSHGRSHEPLLVQEAATVAEQAQQAQEAAEDRKLKQLTLQKYDLIGVKLSADPSKRVQQAPQLHPAGGSQPDSKVGPQAVRCSSSHRCVTCCPMLTHRCATEKVR